MTDKFVGLVITFDQAVNENYIKRVKDVLDLFKGVVDVSPIKENPSIWVAMVKARLELQNKILNVLTTETDKK